MSNTCGVTCGVTCGISGNTAGRNVTYTEPTCSCQVGGGFNIGKRGRFYSSKHSGRVFQRLRRNLLAHHIARVGHAEEDKTTRAVEHAADRLCRVGPLPGGAFEFDTLGLAAENQFFQFVDIHTYLSVFGVLTHLMGIT